MSPPTVVPRTRRYLSADGLFKVLRRRFEDVVDHRRSASVTYPMHEVLMAALAMFSLKDPSLLAFEDRLDDPSLRNIFGITKIPSDSQMRDILDPVDVEPLNEAFADVFWELQRGGVLQKFRFLGDSYLVAIDGTGHFGSTKIRCEHCLEKTGRSGNKSYSHQAVAAVLVHPDLREVIPMAVEPIVRQDGETKNDCERNATARLLRRIKRQHPKLKLVITEDGLSSNAPHIEQLRSLGYSYILGAKPGDHGHLFEAVIEAGECSRYFTITESDPKGSRETSWVRDLPLNKSHEGLRVNYVGQAEITAEGSIGSQFSWVTDLPVSDRNVERVAAGGRSRWRIENETFNTLKNQGYHFEHNYGHGKKRLATVLMLLMMLAFLVDQVQQHCCPLFSAVLEKLGSRRSLWFRLRAALASFVFVSYRELLESILTDRSRYRALPP